MTDYSMGIIILGEKKIQTCLIENKSWQDCGNNYIGYAKEFGGTNISKLNNEYQYIFYHSNENQLGAI